MDRNETGNDERCREGNLREERGVLYLCSDIDKYGI